MILILDEDEIKQAVAEYLAGRYSFKGSADKIKIKLRRSSKNEDVTSVMVAWGN